MLTPPELAAVCNVTYRQLNHWMTQGWIVGDASQANPRWSLLTPTDATRVAVLAHAGRARYRLETIATLLADVEIPLRREGCIVVSGLTELTVQWVAATDLVDWLEANVGPHLVVSTQRWITAARLHETSRTKPTRRTA